MSAWKNRFDHVRTLPFNQFLLTDDGERVILLDGKKQIGQASIKDFEKFIKDSGEAVNFDREAFYKEVKQRRKNWFQKLWVRARKIFS